MKGRKPNLNNVASFPGAKDQERDLEIRREDACLQSDALRPSCLPEGQREIWDRLGPELYLLGRLKAHFVDAFAEYCALVVRLKSARDYLDENDWVYVTTGRHGEQHKSRPEVAQLNDDWRKWRSLTAAFGLTPAEERSIGAPVQGSLFGDGFSDF